MTKLTITILTALLCLTLLAGCGHSNKACDITYFGTGEAYTALTDARETLQALIASSAPESAIASAERHWQEAKDYIDEVCVGSG